MTETGTETEPMRAGRVVLGGIIALTAHALTFGAAFLAGRLAGDSADGMRDLAAVVGTLLIGQAVIALVCLIGGVTLIARGRRDLGLGLLAGWLLGGAAGWLLIQLG